MHQQQLLRLITDAHLDAVVKQIAECVELRRPLLICTANITHFAQLSRDLSFASAYASADLITADGFPVALAAAALNRRRVPRVTGSDILPSLLGIVKSGTTVGILGNSMSTTETISSMFPHLHFEHFDITPNQSSDRESVERYLSRQSDLSNCDLIVISLSTPRQEYVAAAIRDRGSSSVVVPCGAAPDFLAGNTARAPRWMQQVGLEWFHRLTREPRRLGRRYLRDAPAFLVICFRLLALRAITGRALSD